jgi:proton-dependent oligopeptide transporter, POT family
MSEAQAEKSPYRVPPPPKEPTKAHPKGLYLLFFTEMWERFSYYGMRALLMPYMISAAFGYQPEQASSVYKWYTSLVYLAPLLGGFLADRFLGARAAVLIGAVLMALGHFLMAFPAKGLFFAALALLIAGNGFFKPNISTMVGRMYVAGDSRRDSAFTIFYMGINLGAFLSSIACPTLKEKYGFHWGFGAAGVGMAIGLLVFVFGQKRVMADIVAAETLSLEHAEKKKSEAKTEEDDAKLPGVSGFAGVLSKIYPMFMIGSALALWGLYGFKVVSGEAKPISLIMPISFGVVFVVMASILMKLQGRERDKSMSVFIMFLFPVLFWMAFEQAGNALNLWAEYHTDRNLTMLKWEYPGGYWQSANSLMIFALAPVFTVLWATMSRKGQEPSTPWKMFWAMVMMALSFLVMVAGAASETSTTSKVTFAGGDSKSVLTGVNAMNAGRIAYNPQTGELSNKGVLTEFAVRKILDETLPAPIAEKKKKHLEDAKKSKEGTVTTAFPLMQNAELACKPGDLNADMLKELKVTKKQVAQEETQNAAEYSNADGSFLMRVQGDLTACGKGSDGTPKAPAMATVTLTTKGEVDSALQGLLVGTLAEERWKKALAELEKESRKARVSGFWLFLSYLLATLGELCLSPVGLSMVTKLAPARYASLFMGVWLLASSVAQYVGGSIGESWGSIPPTSYFWIFVGTSIAGTVLTLLLASPLKKLMHNVS